MKWEKRKPLVDCKQLFEYFAQLMMEISDDVDLPFDFLTNLCL